MIVPDEMVQRLLGYTSVQPCHCVLGAFDKCTPCMARELRKQLDDEMERRHAKRKIAE